MTAQNAEQGIVFDSIKIGLASPEKNTRMVKRGSQKPETISYRTLKPERDGLFVKEYSGQQKTGNVIVENIKRIRYKGVCV